MKQLLHRIDNGELRLVDTPVPAASGVHLLVEARASVISPGTERMVIELGRASLLQKARGRPDQEVSRWSLRLAELARRNPAHHS